MRSFKTRVLITAAAACLGACQTGSFIHDVDVDPSGTYALRQINSSETVPWTTGVGNKAITITQQTLTLTEGGTWSETTVEVATHNGVQSTDTLSDGGSYTFKKDGSSLILHSTVSNSTPYTGSFVTQTLVLTGTDGNVFYFES